MQDAECKLRREVQDLATRDESPAHRARQCYTGACRPIRCSDSFSRGDATPRRQTRCVTRVPFWGARPLRVVSLNRIGETHGSRKTRHKAPCAAQEVPQEDKRLFPHKEQAVPIGTGSGESSGSLCISRSPGKEAAISPAVDTAHRRGGAVERHHVWPLDSWIEGGGRGTGPQSAG